ncbi:hypothetical protein HK101_001988 [Irineochytrium annulatum]|nr:hypothetical protein HK101_001988 [Irineochytrium annulatum]
MAKGIRSKTKKAFRTLKRNEVFKKTEDDRLERLATKQADPLLCPALPVSELDTSTMATDESAADATAKMETDEKPLTRKQREEIMLSRNQFKKKMRARSRSLAVKRGKAVGVDVKPKGKVAGKVGKRR